MTLTCLIKIDRITLAFAILYSTDVKYFKQVIQLTHNTCRQLNARHDQTVFRRQLLYTIIHIICEQ